MISTALPVLTVSSAVSASISNVSFVTLLPQLSSQVYLQMSTTTSGLFPNGINYQVNTDGTGVATWSVSAANVTQVNSSNLSSAITSSGAWLGSITNTIDCSFTYNGTSQVMKFLPQTANLDVGALGASGISLHLMTMVARAFSMDNRATLQQVFGSGLQTVSTSMTNALATCIENMLETASVQQLLIDTLVTATGPILDFSSPGNKVLSINQNLPSLNLVFNLKDVTMAFALDRLGITRPLVLTGPIPCVLTLIN